MDAAEKEVKELLKNDIYKEVESIENVDFLEYLQRLIHNLKEKTGN